MKLKPVLSTVLKNHVFNFNFNKLSINTTIYRVYGITLFSALLITSVDQTRDRGSTRSASARRQEGDRFESRADTAS